MNTQVYTIIRYVMGEGYPRVWVDDFYYETIDGVYQQLSEEGMFPLPMENTYSDYSWTDGKGNYVEIKVLTRSDN